MLLHIVRGLIFSGALNVLRNIYTSYSEVYNSNSKDFFIIEAFNRKFSDHNTGIDTVNICIILACCCMTTPLNLAVTSFIIAAGFSFLYFLYNVYRKGSSSFSNSNNDFNAKNDNDNNDKLTIFLSFVFQSSVLLLVSRVCIETLLMSV